MCAIMVKAMTLYTWQKRPVAERDYNFTVSGNLNPDTNTISNGHTHAIFAGVDMCVCMCVTITYGIEGA